MTAPRRVPPLALAERSVSSLDTVRHMDLSEDEQIEQRRRIAISRGVKRAWLRGELKGRPKDKSVLCKPFSEAVEEALAQGLSLRQSARHAGVCVNTVRKVKKALDDKKAAERTRRILSSPNKYNIASIRCIKCGYVYANYAELWSVVPNVCAFCVPLFEGLA